MQDIIDFCEGHTKIYIYGYGKWAKNLTYFLDKIGVGIEKYIVTENNQVMNSDMVISYSHGMIKEGEGIIIAIKEYENVYEMLIKDCTYEQILKPN